MFGYSPALYLECANDTEKNLNVERKPRNITIFKDTEMKYSWFKDSTNILSYLISNI